MDYVPFFYRFSWMRASLSPNGCSPIGGSPIRASLNGGGWTLHLVLGTILTNQYCFDKIERLCENCAVVIIVPFLVVNL